MFGKGNKIYSIVSGACPKCHSEPMYVEKNPYKISDTLNMHERCSKCNFKYQIEPSFFYGSMYVSYGVGVAFAVIAFIISNVLLDSSLLTAFIVIVATLIGFMPIIMRVSRNIWINLFVKYDKLARKDAKAQKN